MLPPYKTKKEKQYKPTAGWRRETVNTGADISEMENGEPIEEIKETKTCCIERSRKLIIH